MPSRANMAPADHDLKSTLVMSAGRPFFTVITPSWNQGQFLAECIESVMTQGDTDFEHLIFDNQSADSTHEVASRYSHLRFVSEKDRGQSHAVNKGLAAANGEIICWLNADDAYPAGLFGRLREVFADPSCDVVFGDVEQVAYDGSAKRVAEAFFRNRTDLLRWWESRARLHQPAVFFRRKVATQAGPLREDLHYAMDYEYWWRISENFRFHRVHAVLAVQHRQPDSKTVRAWHKVYEEREKAFAPFYALIDGGNRRAFLKEKRRGLARRYLLDAFSALPKDKITIWENLLRAWKESPTEVIQPSTLGLMRRLVSPKSF